MLVVRGIDRGHLVRLGALVRAVRLLTVDADVTRLGDDLGLPRLLCVSVVGRLVVGRLVVGRLVVGRLVVG